jgi:hypothetical protein
MRSLDDTVKPGRGLVSDLLAASAAFAGFAHRVQHRLTEAKLAIVKAALFACFHHRFDEERSHLLPLLTGM